MSGGVDTHSAEQQKGKETGEKQRKRLSLRDERKDSLSLSLSFSSFFFNMQLVIVTSFLSFSSFFF